MTTKRLSKGQHKNGSQECDTSKQKEAMKWGKDTTRLDIEYKILIKWWEVFFKVEVWWEIRWESEVKWGVGVG